MNDVTAQDLKGEAGSEPAMNDQVNDYGLRGGMRMRIAIVSGKGGTGKTMVAVNLAYLAAQAGLAVAYVDCNVEGPNGHIFLQPDLGAAAAIYKKTPRWDEGKCAFCGECRRVCQFQAIVCLDWQVLINSKLCQACGRCLEACPHDSLTESPVEIGSVLRGPAGLVHFVAGRLRIGEAQSAPLIQAVKAAIPPVDLALLDAPPGISGPIMETLRDVHFLLLLTEPTPFGLEDLQLTTAMAKDLNLRTGVVINRARVGQTNVRQYCWQTGLPILAEIPDDFSIVEACGEGKLILEELPGYRRIFSNLLREIAQLAGPTAWRTKMAAAIDIMTRAQAKVDGPRPAAGDKDRPVCYLAFRQKNAGPASKMASPESPV